MEVKLVLFSPKDGFHAVDVYVDGNRVYCGQGFQSPKTAMLTTMKWLETAMTERIAA
jgi:hypothetical protein